MQTQEQNQLAQESNPSGVKVTVDVSEGILSKFISALFLLTILLL